MTEINDKLHDILNTLEDLEEAYMELSDILIDSTFVEDSIMHISEMKDDVLDEIEDEY